MPLITNVMGSTAGEVASSSRRSPSAEIAALELNVSCPNVETGLDIGADPAELAAVVGEVRPRTAKPLIVKLTPNTADVAAVAQAAEEAGADAVSLINTLRAYGARTRGASARRGSAAGPAGCPVRRSARWPSPRSRAVAARVEIPVIGMGGVQSRRTPRTCSTRARRWSAVGTESFRDPAAGARIATRAWRFVRKERGSPRLIAATPHVSTSPKTPANAAETVKQPGTT